MAAQPLEAAILPGAGSRRFGLGFWLAGEDRGPGPAPSFGSDLWTADDAAAPADLAMAAGESGQRLYVVSSRGVTIARLGAAEGWSDRRFLELITAG